MNNKDYDTLINDADNIITSALDASKSSADVYDAQQKLLHLWRYGARIELLVSLLHSETMRTRLIGATLLADLGQNVPDLNAHISRLYTDSIPQCRWSVINYTASADIFDDNISRSLAICLSDLHLYVRLSVIKWACKTTDDRLSSFKISVINDISEPKFRRSRAGISDYWRDSAQRRGERALDIIQRIRQGDDLDTISHHASGEDSFVLDGIRAWLTRNGRTETAK